MRKGPLVIGISGVAAGLSLMIAGLASNGFHSCDTGAGRDDRTGTTLCSHALVLLAVAGVIVIILGVLMVVGAMVIAERA